MSLEPKRKPPQQQQQGAQSQPNQQAGSRPPANRPKPSEPDGWRGEGVVSTNHTD